MKYIIEGLNEILTMNQNVKNSLIKNTPLRLVLSLTGHSTCFFNGNLDFIKSTYYLEHGKTLL